MRWRDRVRGWLVRLAGASVTVELPGMRFAWSGPRVDPLTGLPDRRALRASLEAACAAGPTAVLFVDLDDFKGINDARGHGTGDVVLAEVAERLRTWRGAGEQVGRWGGDELIAVLPGCDLDRARARAGALLLRLRAPVPVEGRPVQVTASIGLAASPEPDPDRLLAQADRAAYAAKSEGGDRFAVAPLRLVRARE